MNLKEYVTKAIPKACGVEPAYGYIAWMVFEEEKLGNPVFARDKFKTTRDRAKLALPFNPKNKKAYEECLDVIELLLLIHEQKHHFIDNKDAIIRLETKRVYTLEETDMVTADWWSA